MTWLKTNATFSNMLKVLVIVFVAGGIYTTYLFSQKIDLVDNKVVKLRSDFDMHMVAVAGAPITDHDVQLRLADHSTHILSNTVEVKRVSDIQITVRTKQDEIVKDVSEIKESQLRQVDTDKEQTLMLGKIMGKLGIE